MKKKLVITALVVTALAASAVGSRAFAASSSSSPSLVQTIANKFGLNSSDVQGVFDQYRQQHSAQMQQNYQTRLDQLVKDGKITSAQESLILAEHQKLQSEHQSDVAKVKDLTPDQRKALLTSIRQEISDWSKQNNIPAKYLMPGIGMHRMGMFFGADSAQH